MMKCLKKTSTAPTSTLSCEICTDSYHFTEDLLNANHRWSLETGHYTQVGFDQIDRNKIELYLICVPFNLLY